MKDSKKYAKKIQKLYRALKGKHSEPKLPVYDEPIEAVIRAILSEKLPSPEAKTAYAKCLDYVVDFNELRVTRPEEIATVMGGPTPLRVEVATTLTTALSAVFNKYHKMSLEPLKKIGKRPAKQILDEFAGFSHFTVSYCMLTALAGHAIPLTPRMAEYLRDEGLVYPTADEADIEGFLTKQVSAKDGYEFYSLLRREAESTKPKKKKTPKKTAKKKAASAENDTKAETTQKKAKTTKKKTTKKLTKKK